jgi:hypothetical protein
MKNLIAAIFCAAALLSTPLFAQTKPADDMQAMAQKVKADRKAFVARNMQLADSEARGFWPVYDAYQQDLQKINERLYKVIETYAKAYKSNSLTDEQANSLLIESLAIEEAEVTLRKSYLPRLGKVLPPKKVARFMQVENKIRAQVRYELAVEIPLVP